MNSGTSALQSIGTVDCSSVTNVISPFGNLYLADTYPNLTSLGGFLQLGKAFTSGGTHLLDLPLHNLTKTSVMNVINNLSAPDDSTVVDATLKLHANAYALLDASDIAVATAKNWSVTSA